MKKKKAWKEVLVVARDEVAKDNVWRSTKKRKRLKGVFIIAKRRLMNSLEGK